MEALARIMAKLDELGMSSDEMPMTPREYEQYKVDGLNAAEGDLHERDGYRCRLCRNKGIIVRLEERNGIYIEISSECKCMETRRSILRMKRSGLKDIIKEYTFEKFVASEPWQQVIRDAAVEYARNPERRWFFLGGQSGAGKTHLCTAICRELLLEGKSVQYMLWRDDISKIKAAAMDPETLDPIMHRFKTVSVLYIDDLFKTGKAPDGSYQRPTTADINYAFEIINYRYNNPELLTIISSEWSEDDLLDIDEATAGRIYERAVTFSIAKDRCRNYRIKNAVTL